MKVFLIFQVSGYGEKFAAMAKIPAQHNIEQHAEEGSCVSAFQALANMLLSLTNNDGDGRIIISRFRLTSLKKQGGYLKYVMLSGEKIFSEVCLILLS